MELLSTNLCFGGEHRRYRHASHALACDMEFAVFLPPAALGPEPAPVPVLYWLSGLTCTDQNFMQKAGAQRLAAQLGLAIVCPDTSPRASTCRARTTATISAPVPASISTPPGNPGPGTTGCTTMW